MKKQFRKKTGLRAAALLIALALMTGVLGGCASNAPEKTAESVAEYAPLSIRAGVTTSGFAYPFYVAQEQGIFEKYNITCGLDSYGTGAQTMDALILGQEDLGEGMDYAAVVRFAEDSNMRVLSYMAEANPLREGLFVQGDISSIEEIANKRIGVRKGTINEYIWMKLFEKYGIDGDSVERIELSSDAEIITAFVNGGIDAIFVLTVFADQLDEADVDYTYLGSLDLINISQKAFILLDKDFIEENQDGVARFLLALSEAEDYIVAEPEDTADIIYRTMAIERDTALADIDNYNWDIRFTQEDYDHIVSLSQWVQENGITQNSYDITEFIDVEPLRSVLPDKVSVE